jgi:hypothetical protein
MIRPEAADSEFLQSGEHARFQGANHDWRLATRHLDLKVDTGVKHCDGARENRGKDALRDVLLAPGRFDSPANPE